MQRYWVWYSLASGISQGRKKALLGAFADVRALYEARGNQVSGFEKEMQALGKAPAMEQITQQMAIWQAEGIWLLTPEDAAYPQSLWELRDPPLLLYGKGQMPDFFKAPGIGVVGTRKADAYGLRTARKMASEIAACGGIVISGGASGIDTQALEGGLEAGGQTVAILGCGVDIAYPACNKALFSLVAQNGCLLSEYSPGTKPQPWQFPERNRIISALSHGVLVVQAPEKSGAMITARLALKQNKDVYAVPGNIDTNTAGGSNALLQQGAMAVFSGWDILKAYQYQFADTIAQREPVVRPMFAGAPVAEYAANNSAKTDGYNINKKIAVDNPINSPYIGMETQPLSPMEQQVLSALTHTPIHQDLLADRLELPTVQLMGIVTKLAMGNLVSIYPGKMIALYQG